MERYGLVHPSAGLRTGFEPGPNRQLAPRVNYSGVELERSLRERCPHRTHLEEHKWMVHSALIWYSLALWI